MKVKEDIMMLKGLFRGTALLAVALMLTVGQSAFALPVDAQQSSVDPGDVRGPVQPLDDFLTCTWDYFGMAFTGSGGQGGFGTNIWPGGTYGGNYGLLCFQRTCIDEEQETTVDTVYAYCNDVDHALMQSAYCATMCSLIVDPNQPCSAEQLRAIAYILA